MSEKISALNQRDELLAYLLENAGIQQSPEYPTPSSNHTDAPPLSFTQERFWFLNQFERAHPIYNGCKAILLLGELNVEALVQSINLVVSRHDILRTTYPAPEGIPIPRISRHAYVEIPIADLGHIPNASLFTTIEQLAHEEWMRPIDLAKELPIRVRVFRIDTTEYLLLLTLHQIAADSHSVMIFLRELWNSYTAKVNGLEPELPLLPIQYGDLPDGSASALQKKPPSHSVNIGLTDWLALFQH